MSQISTLEAGEYGPAPSPSIGYGQSSIFWVYIGDFSDMQGVCDAIDYSIAKCMRVCTLIFYLSE